MLIGFLLATLSVAEATPVQFTQQGRLMESNGSAVSGTHTLTFRLSDSTAGTFYLWEESLLVSFVNGYYTAILGANSASNPLEDNILQSTPLYLEVEVDNNGPFTPRQELTATPYARIATTAENLDGGMANASELKIGGSLVIDANGSWVGPTQLVDWGNITNIPADIADGDNDALSGLTCSAGQIVGWNGASWICTDDNGLTESEVENFIENDPINLAAGSQMGGLNLLTTADQGDSLADLSCQNGELPKWDMVTGWQCDVDLVLTEADVENHITNDPINLAAGSQMGGLNLLTTADQGDSLADLSCQNGELPKWDTASGWHCDIDLVLTEADVENHIANGAMDFMAGSSVNGRDIMTAVNCQQGEIVSWDAANGLWECTSFQSLLDADSDSVLAWNDCDDADPLQGSNVNDNDCDSITSSDDCNDFDPNSNTISQDADCDGSLTADDCNDNDPNSTLIANDADCDGVLSAEDCDDSNPSSTTVAADADCDSFITADDCDDGNAAINPNAIESCQDGVDNDCNGDTDCDDSACSSVDPACWVCGNNVVDPNESCDDGNTNSGDGCSSTCDFESQQITEVCNLNASPDYSFCGGNCSDNTQEFADAYCVLAGFNSAQNYTTHTSGSRMSYYYNGGSSVSLTQCSQLNVGSYGAATSCTCVTDLICQ